MSDKKKGYSEYRNIDTGIIDTTYLKNVQANELDDERKSQTLDLYNDDMSKKAVNSLFKNYENNASNQKVTENSQNKDYNGSNNSKKSNNNFSSNEDTKFGGFKYDEKNKAYNFRDTSFSSAKIMLENESLEEVRRNKEILKKLESRETNSKVFKELGLYGENSKHTTPAKKTTNKSNKNISKVAYFRIFTLVTFTILLIVLAGALFKVNDLSAKLIAAQSSNKTLTDTNNQLSQLKIENNQLKEQLTALKNASPNSNGTTKDATGTTTDVVVPATSTTVTPTPTNPVVAGPTTYTVVSGDNLSKISKKFYGNSNSFDKIMKANNMKTQNITIGQKLTIPK